MAKEEISYLKYAAETLRCLEKPGLLLVTQGKANKPNVMTIGWATLGNLWVAPCFVVLVRPSRYSFGLLEECREFTVNVLPANLSDAAAYCGSVSGRDQDKFADQGLTPIPSQQVTVPIIEECVIHYECRVVHHNDVAAETMPDEFLKTAYPEGDHHRLYYGEILGTYTDSDAIERI